MKTKYLVIAILVLLFGSTISWAADGSVNTNAAAYGLDTISGHSTVLRTSKTVADADIDFIVKKPDGSMIKVPAKTNAQGVAITDLSDYHTKVSGEYEVTIKFSNGGVSQWNSFLVYPGEPSLQFSSITPLNEVADVNEKVVLKASLFDDNKNPIQAHQVKLISSSITDKIEVISEKEYTNENGEIEFQVSSAVPGPATYSIYDVTANAVLESKAKVVYMDSAGYLFSSPDPYFNYAATGNSSGPVDHLKFEEIPENINPGEPTTLKLTAYDDNEEVVTNYNGEVRFSISSSNSAYADLPEDYTFKVEDQGSHTFSLAFNFQRVGSYEIRATDTDNIAIFAVENIQVIESGSLSTDPAERAKIKINSPLAGSYSNKAQTISGVAEPASGLKIFDNEVAIASVVAGLDGKFSYTANNLSDGEHSIYVAEVNDAGTIVDVSATVIFNIDTSGPGIKEVVFDPKGEVIPGSLVKVKMLPDVSLSQAAIVVGSSIIELEKVSGGYYEGVFAAPIEFGEYNLEFVLTDELGNESRIKEGFSFKVGAVSIEPRTKPAAVQNLVVRSDDRRISLSWSPVTDSYNPVVRYRVYYGLSPNELTEAVDTFTTAPNWYVPNLVNGTQYYFTVVAVDSKGNISENFSNIVIGVPNPIVVERPSVDVMNGTAGAEALKHLESDVSETGPEMLWLVVISALAGFSYVRFSKKA